MCLQKYVQEKTRGSIKNVATYHWLHIFSASFFLMLTLCWHCKHSVIILHYEVLSIDIVRAYGWGHRSVRLWQPISRGFKLTVWSVVSQRWDPSWFSGPSQPRSSVESKRLAAVLYDKANIPCVKAWENGRMGTQNNAIEDTGPVENSTNIIPVDAISTTPIARAAVSAATVSTTARGVSTIADARAEGPKNAGRLNERMVIRRTIGYTTKSNNVRNISQRLFWQCEVCNYHAKSAAELDCDMRGKEHFQMFLKKA